MEAEEKEIEEIKVIKQSRLLRMFKDNKGLKNSLNHRRFCFLLGAGTSKSSGIPLANTLAQKWLKELKEDAHDETEREEFNTWKKRKKIDEENLAKSYTTIYYERFKDDLEAGHHEIQTLMENKEPSIGYLIFAQLIEKTDHNFVITTNFDSLIEDALYFFSASRPFVCGHESLATFVSPHSKRPTIIKVHRDIFLAPKNTEKETKRLQENYQQALTPILNSTPLIVLGYGGNDESIKDYLTNLPSRQAIYIGVAEM